ncbi:hypothetical protein ABFX02_06G180300 [Erythranthe guttata]
MSSRTLHIKDIIDTTTCWSVQVMVYEKTQERQSSSSPCKYQRIIFMDAKEDKIVSTIFGADINLFKDTFELNSTYTISNAKVTRIADKYNKYGHPYQWTINRKTAYQLETENNIPYLGFKCQFASLCTIANFIGQDTVLDVLAIVIDRKAHRSFTTGDKHHFIKEYALINQEQRVIILTLWNDVAKSEGNLIDNCKESMPIIKVSGLIVSPYFGGSLGSTPSTVIVVDPKIPEAENLKTWREAHIKSIAATLAMNDPFAHIDDHSTINSTNISSIADIVADNKVDKYVVKVCATITDAAQKCFYMGCSKCHYAIDADYNQSYTCSTCKENTHATPREKISLCITDNSGSLDVTAFGMQAVDILEQNAVACMEQYNEEIPLAVGVINKRLQGRHFLMKIRKKGCHIRNAFQFQYSVQSLQSADIPQPQNEFVHVTNECSSSTHASPSKKLRYEGNADQDGVAPN